MNFVYPAFLWALAALAFPIIIHLFNFRRFRTIYFTNVKFLKNIQEETATKNRLKHLLILISRLLAITALVFAFAQPFLPSKQTNEQSKRKAVSIYIDNSFSMEATDNDEQLLGLAKRKAEEIVNAYTIDDQFQLITNDFEARHQRMLSKDEILQMISEVQLSPVVQPMEEVFKRQKDIINRETDKEKIVFLLSDFQKSSMNLENDSSYQVNLFKVTATEQRNVAIDSAWFITPVQMINEQLQLCILVKNYSNDEVKNVPVTLKLNGQIKSITDVTIAANSEIRDTLSFIVNDQKWQSGEISVTDYPVSFDDQFYFSFEPVSKIPVLCINGNGQNNFIQSIFEKNPLFEFVNYSYNQIQFNDLGKFNLILLNQLPSVSGGLAQALNQRLEEGANLVLFPDPSMDRNSVNQFLSGLKAGEFGELINSKRNVTAVNVNHPLLQGLFEKIPQNLTMPFATKSFMINSFSSTLEEPIMSFADGKPFLATYPVREGNLLITAAPPLKEFTDLPVQGYFVLIMYQFAISSEKQGEIYSTIGNEKWIVLNDLMISGDQTVHVKNEQNEFIPEMRKAGNKTEVNLSNYTNVSGLYTVEGSTSTQTIALNYNRSESDLSFYSNDELKEMFDEKNVTIFDRPEQNLTGAVAQLSSGTPLWKYCVIFALIFLATEILLIRWLP